LGVRLGAAVLGAAIVVAWSWRPFNFVLSPEVARDRLPGLFQLPLQRYFAADPLSALADASAKVALALALGALLDASMPVTVSRTARTIALAVGLLGVYTLAEIGQLFLPGRYPDSTDILLGVSAGSLGCAVRRGLSGRAYGG
jgi:VanZ family protein